MVVFRAYSDLGSDLDLALDYLVDLVPGLVDEGASLIETAGA